MSRVAASTRCGLGHVDHDAHDHNHAHINVDNNVIILLLIITIIIYNNNAIIMLPHFERALPNIVTW